MSVDKQLIRICKRHYVVILKDNPSIVYIPFSQSANLVFVLYDNTRFFKLSTLLTKTKPSLDATLVSVLHNIATWEIPQTPNRTFDLKKAISPSQIIQALKEHIIVYIKNPPKDLQTFSEEIQNEYKLSASNTRDSGCNTMFFNSST